MYKPPIEIIQHRANYDCSKQLDEAVFTAVVRADIHVERDELIKALQYDRDQYQKGFEDGKSFASQWISVKGRLPEEEKEVLCYLGNSIAKLTVVSFRRRGEWYFDGWPCPTVTHWMPLPEPPKEDEKND